MGIRRIVKKIASALGSLGLGYIGFLLVKWWWDVYYTQTYACITPLIQDLANLSIGGGVVCFIIASVIFIFGVLD
jgi:hypothetical protein